MGIYYHQRLTVNYVSCPPKITPKNEKVFKKLKFVVNAKQGVHIWIFKGAESKKWHLFCAKTTHSLCFGLVLSEVSSIPQIVVGRIPGNIHHCMVWYAVWYWYWHI